LRIEFDAAGYPLAVSEIQDRALVEVYPHPALIELVAAERRLPYKQSKVGKYWPDLLPGTRREKLLEVWADIIRHLNDEITGVAATLKLPSAEARGYELKAFEDMLDAVVCAWVGTCVVDGKAKPYGDRESAIWVPVRT
jgi:predicted RNase H-like nuclease